MRRGGHSRTVTFLTIWGDWLSKGWLVNAVSVRIWVSPFVILPRENPIEVTPNEVGEVTLPSVSEICLNCSPG